MSPLYSSVSKWRQHFSCWKSFSGSVDLSWLCIRESQTKERNKKQRKDYPCEQTVLGQKNKPCNKCSLHSRNIKPQQVNKKTYARTHRHIPHSPAVVLILCEMMHVHPLVCSKSDSLWALPTWQPALECNFAPVVLSFEMPWCKKTNS